MNGGIHYTFNTRDIKEWLLECGHEFEDHSNDQIFVAQLVMDEDIAIALKLRYGDVACVLIRPVHTLIRYE